MSNLSVIVYRSRATYQPTDVDLLYLLAHARERNRIANISGVFLYDRGHFFQWIEGTNQELGKLWNRIRADPRHAEIRVLADQAIPVRLFEDWNMQLAHRSRQHEGISESFVIADPNVLDDLHLNPNRVPSILASFSKLGGSFNAVIA